MSNDKMLPAGDEAERIHGYRFPDQSVPTRSTPRPTGTLEEIYARIDADTPAARLNEDLDRIEGALAKLEQAVRDAMEDEQR
ncbi:hypothetical protein HB662_12170 [Roseomonas frigidaquae]|uniref:Uncharacterized protein n=1 Tax=Falsiroseomonas frigidaquae TaxID=487318 RepID=A0ABX1EZN1_9PROT|nr:hypothetical protein [Falsiroseomonas frigidaquae]NKE45535.1 hypothetical protein [Falsiroseomonas frigidaquae]